MDRTRHTAFRPVGRTGVEAPLRMFCLPYAGGSARMYADWERHLPPFVQVTPVELPGRGSRLAEPPHTRVEPLVDDLLPRLLAAGDGPYALFGYSLGALVAFELARALERRYRRPPVRLFVGAFRAPHLPRGTVPDYDLPEPQFRERLRAFNGTPEEVLADESLMEMLIPTLRADLAVADTYRHREGRPLTCPITAFAGSEDAEVRVSSVSQWRRHTDAGFTLKVLEGDHFFLHQQERALLGELSAAVSV
ncbi:MULTISPECIES: thioesterase II family protein [unclassified Streptomyces]|uniref:thioesterase II family protein n=1 Tax=unclassified Streptomyces TaxID=2593676 RepID=UPI0022B72ED5|nr:MULTISPECIES: alpha/beta fold hydrolase [unclassified Streptomyces]MCZ7415693.1 alpha/beta fold hydrolase [Streptomyces sp. WMMC897]MCZ7434496.1 alpha/beta fold hydrolase [Streptomyces sp. WMMC1477]